MQEGSAGRDYFSVYGHAFSVRDKASGQKFAKIFGQQAGLMGGGQPL